MAESHLHGYFSIDGKLFLVRKSVTSMFELLSFLLQADGYDDIPEALEHAPRVMLDRRSTSLLALLPRATPINRFIIIVRFIAIVNIIIHKSVIFSIKVIIKVTFVKFSP